MTFIPTNTGSGPVSASVDLTVANQGASPFPPSPNNGVSSTEESLSVNLSEATQGVPALTQPVTLAGVPAGYLQQFTWYPLD